MFVESVKYEVVLGLEKDNERLTVQLKNVDLTSFIINRTNKAKEMWQKYAKEFYDTTGIYVSAICEKTRAIYNTEWGCPKDGEFTISFHCTANPEFIKDFNKYEEGVLYITKRLKRDFEQHTVTITKIPASVCYLTDEDNLEV
jgi:CRISPR/Cas system-associated protein Cas7 (RAMP superfamily)